MIVGCDMKRTMEIRTMLSYMEKKYGEEFQYIEAYGGQLGKNYIAILVKGKRYPEEEILVRKRTWQKQVHYEDNYVAYLLREELEAEMGDVAKRTLGACRVRYKIPQFVLTDEFTPEMTAKEFLCNLHAKTQFYLYPQATDTSCKEWEEKTEAFLKECGRKGYRIRGALVLNKEDKKGNLIFSMDEENQIRYMRWVIN